MMIHLPDHLERYVHDQVVAGRFRSEDDVILEAVPFLSANPGKGEYLAVLCERLKRVETLVFLGDSCILG